MPSRVVHQGDGVAWLEQAALGPEHAVVTSLPDVSEVPLDFDAWRAWFVGVARLACERTHPESVAVFFQTDIKHEGRWVDKAYLVQRGDTLRCQHDKHRPVGIAQRCGRPLRLVEELPTSRSR